ncbi:MAG: hypothetical protein ACRD4O_08365 [Bryobacteraceae bacterium]
MDLPRFVLVEQAFPDRAIGDIPGRIRQELTQSALARRVPRGARIAIGVGSRGISNIHAIVKSVVEFWKEQGARPFIFPAMGSHGAATAEGQADVLAHFGIHEATMGVPVISSLDVVPLGRTPEGMETFLDKNAYESDGVFLIGRIKWHTDFSGAVESGIFKMMAIGLGKFAGARQYHTFGYKLGLERVIRSVGSKVFASGKVLGALAVQEGAHHETAGLLAIDGAAGAEAVLKREEELLSEVKSWMATLPAPEIDVLIVDEIGKNISGAGMDTKVINRTVNCHYNPFPDMPVVHRIYARGLTDLSYGSGVGIGMADVVHGRLLNGIDWKPTYINSLTACTPACIRTPIHFGSDRDVLDHIAPTVGKADLSQVTFCRIRNTQELIDLAVSENLVPALYPQAKVVSAPFEVPFLGSNDFGDFEAAAKPLGKQTLAHERV